MPRARRNEDRIARTDHSTFVVEFYLARAFEDEIKLLCDLVPLCSASCGDARFRETLVLDRRIRVIENGAFGKSDAEGKAAVGSGE